MSLALWLICLCPQASSSLELARVELEGPLSEATLEAGAAPTRVHVELLSGERLRLEVPLERDSAGRSELRGARLLEWLQSSTAVEELPGALRTRERPPAPQSAHSLGWIAGAALGAGWLLVTLSATRVRVALAAGALSALLVWLSESSRALPQPPTVRVLDGSTGQADWLLVDGARERLELEPGVAPRLMRAPPRARLELEVLPAGGSVRWLARAPGAALWRLARVRPGLRALHAQLNAWGDFEAVWTRTEAGEWRSHGGWSRGRALPQPAAGAAPPAWLAAGLPQGRGVLAGRLAAGAWAGGGPRPDEAWVRLVGFE